MGGNYEQGPFSNFKFQEDLVSLEFPESCEDGWRMIKLNPIEVANYSYAYSCVL